jgi:hypothetical protein
VLTGRPPDPRADLFTVGALAIYVVTARPPFTAASLPELIGQMLQPAAPVTLPADVPPAAAQAISRCLAADPSARGTLTGLRVSVRVAAPPA